MTHASIFCLVLFLLYPLVGATQPWTEDDWVPLTNELSRSELLRMHMPQDPKAVPRIFRFPQDTLSAAGRRTFGLDISHHNPSNIPFHQLRDKNIHFVYMKATQGVTHKDQKFGHFWNSIGNLPAHLKVARGAYHFLSALSSSDPELQAERFVAYVNLNGGFEADDLPPVMDLEWDKASPSSPDRWANYTPAQIVSKALKFLIRVEELTGKTPMIYVSRAWWRERRIPESEIARFARYRLWIPDYSRATLENENPRGPNGVIPDLWQFTDSSRITGGPSANLDANMFDGPPDEFLEIFRDR